MNNPENGAMLQEGDSKIQLGPTSFYENRHAPSLRIDNSVQDRGFESWIFYNTVKYS
jgi:hypothetical protein